MVRSFFSSLVVSTGLVAGGALGDVYINPLTSSEGMTGFGTSVVPSVHQGRAGLQLIVDSNHRSVDEGGCDNCTVMLMDGLDFGDGSIEIELSGDRAPGAELRNRGFVGIVFRAAEDGSAFEGVYLRPLNSIDEVQARRNFTVQYFSYPDHYWRELRENSPGMYESWAPVRPGEWSRMRVDVQASRAEVYIDDIEIPVLVVSDLKLGADRRGSVGLFTEPNQEAFFRDLKVTPAAAHGPLVAGDDGRMPRIIETVRFQTVDGADADAFSAYLNRLGGYMNRYDTLLARTVAHDGEGHWLLTNYWTDREAMERINAEFQTQPPSNDPGLFQKFVDFSTMQLSAHEIRDPE